MCEAFQDYATSMDDLYGEDTSLAPLKGYVTIVGSKKWKCNFGCSREPYTGYYTSIRAHLIGLYPGEKNLGVPLCPIVCESMREKMKTAEDEAKRIHRDKLKEKQSQSSLVVRLSVKNAYGEEKNLAPLKKYVTIVGSKNKNWTCNFGCRREPYTGYYKCIRAHLIGLYPGEKNLGMTLCPNVSENEREKMQEEEAEAKRDHRNKLQKKKAQTSAVVAPYPKKKMVPSATQKNSPRDGNKTAGIEERDFFNNKKCFIRSNVQNLNNPSAEIAISLASQEIKPVISPLSKLKPPCPLVPNQISPEILQNRAALVRNVKDNLISDLTKTVDVNYMVALANRSFTYLDKLCVDYVNFHKAVHDFISYHFDLASAEAEKCQDVRLQSRYKELEARSEDASLALSRAKLNLSNLNQIFLPIRDREVWMKDVSSKLDIEISQLEDLEGRSKYVEEISSRTKHSLSNASRKLITLRAEARGMKEALSKVEVELTRGNNELAALEAEVVRCTGVYNDCISELARICPEVERAKSVARDIEQRQENAVAGIDKLKELMSIV